MTLRRDRDTRPAGAGHPSQQPFTPRQSSGNEITAAAGRGSILL